jgi:hypothetical protein
VQHHDVQPIVTFGPSQKTEFKVRQVSEFVPFGLQPSFLKNRHKATGRGENGKPSVSAAKLGLEGGGGKFILSISPLHHSFM